MFKRDRALTIAADVTWFGRTMWCVRRNGKKLKFAVLQDEQYQSILTTKTPFHLTADGRLWRLSETAKPPMRCWMYEGEFFWEDQGLSAEEVKALADDLRLRNKKQIERAKSRVASAAASITGGERAPIPDDVKVLVWQRDKGRCVRCGTQENLEFDHIIALAKGGSNTFRNLQILCADCNREKGCELA